MNRRICGSLGRRVNTFSSLTIVVGLLVPAVSLNPTAAYAAPQLTSDESLSYQTPPPPDPIIESLPPPLSPDEPVSSGGDDVIQAAAVAIPVGNPPAQAPTISQRSDEIVAVEGVLPVRLVNQDGVIAAGVEIEAEAVTPALATALSPVGLAFHLEIPEGDDGEVTASTLAQMQLEIDYSQLALPYGGGFANRLSVVRLSDCRGDGEDVECATTDA